MTDISRRDFLKLARDGFPIFSGALAFVGFLIWRNQMNDIATIGS